MFGDVSAQNLSWLIICFTMAKQPPVDQDPTIIEVSRSHTTTHHSR